MKRSKSHQQFRRNDDADDGAKPRRTPVREWQTPAWLEHEHAIIAAFEQIEQARDAMQNAANELAILVETDPRGEWQQKWQRFIDAGGVTVDEFCRWMVLKRQIRPIRRREHLRLIASKPPTIPRLVVARERDNKNKTSIPRYRSRRAMLRD